MTDFTLSDDEFGRHRPEREFSADRLADVGEALVATIQDLVTALGNLSTQVAALQNAPDATHLDAADQTALDDAVTQANTLASDLQAIANPPPPAAPVTEPTAPGGTSPEQPTGLTP